MTPSSSGLSCSSFASLDFDANCRESFRSREGRYRLVMMPEFPASAPRGLSSSGNRYTAAAASSSAGGVNASGSPASGSAPPVRVSFLGNIMTFNFGRELFVYPYNNGSALEKPLDKRVYKGTCPTSHDFAGNTEEGGPLSLLVGFSGGQVQLLDPLMKELSQLYNEERFVDKTRVTRVKWLPGGGQDVFLCSHASGNIYVYNRDLPCLLHAPSYVTLKKGDGYAVHVQSKSSGKGTSSPPSKNPVLKWTIGRGSVNEFSFSPCGNFLAVVGQDGYLRIFNYESMELVGSARSYFGGLLCVSWSPDGKYIVSGGEDDLVTVYSFLEKRVVVRGQGHKSWVSVVAFDPFNMSFGEVPDGFDGSASEEDREDEPTQPARRSKKGVGVTSPCSEEADHNATGSSNNNNVTCYRFGSVGQDTYICLWDITEDILKGSSPPISASSTAMGKSNASSPNSSLGALTSGSFSVCSKDSGVLTDTASSSSHQSSSLSHRLAALSFGGDKRDKKPAGAVHTGSTSKNSSRSSSASLPCSSSGGGGSAASSEQAPEEIKLGSQQCPRIYEIPLIEPLVVKKVAHERLTALVFREEYLVTACQDGYVRTWARPGKMSVGGNPAANSLCPGSPPTNSSVSLSSCCNTSSNNNNTSSGGGSVPSADGTIV